MLALFAVVAFVTGRLYERLGGRPVIIAGTALLAAGPLVVSFFGADSGYAVAGPGPRAGRDRRRLLLPVDHDRGGDDARRLALEPRRRDHLHVPDRRRRDRPRADHGAVHEPLRGRRGQRGERRRPADDRRPGRGDPRRTSPAPSPARPPSTSSTARSPTRSSTWSRTRSSSGVQLSLRVVAAIALVGLVIAIRGVRRRPVAETADRSADDAGSEPPPTGAPEAGRQRRCESRNAPDAPGLEVLPLLRGRARSRARRRRPTRA